MMPVSHRTQMNCTKKNPNRTDAMVFVWTKHTCTVDWTIRAARTATDSASTSAPPTLPTYSANTIAPKTGRFSMQFAWARVARRYHSAPPEASAGKSRIGTVPLKMRVQR
jgi:hypothetical protein